MIDIIDNQISNKEEIYNEIINLNYFYGESDHDNTPPAGMISNLDIEHKTFKTLNEFCKKQKDLNSFSLYRAYVNLFSPREYFLFHPDNDANKTLIYYPNLDWDLNEGGETKFISDNHTLVSILPIPGRIIIFNSEIVHCATSFRDRHRFSVVFKFR